MTGTEQQLRSAPLQSLKDFLAEQVRIVDRALDSWVPADTVQPTSIHQAMRYSLFAGGKRIRPVLAMAAAKQSVRRP